MNDNQLSLTNRLKKAIKMFICDLNERRYQRIIRECNIAGYKRIYFLHIRKTGGTSLNKMFLSLGQDCVKLAYQQLAKNKQIILGGKIFVAWDTRLINKGNYFYAFSHAPLHKLQLPNNTFTIVCFRDPVKRVISHYNMLREYKLKNIYHPCMSREGIWLGKSFDDFLSRIPKEHLLNQLFMFSENYDVEQALYRVRGISHYFFTEDFNEGIRGINRKLNLDLTPVLTRQSTRLVEIPNKSISRLRERLSIEYEFINTLKEYSN